MLFASVVSLLQSHHLIEYDVVFAQLAYVLFRVALGLCGVGPCGSPPGVATTGGGLKDVLKPFVPSLLVVTLVTTQPCVRVAQNGDV